MDDLTMTKLCAEAHGWTCEPAGLRRYRVYAAGDKEGETTPIYGIGEDWVMQKYDPLNDDSQAFELIKQFNLVIEREKGGGLFGVTFIGERKGRSQVVRAAANLNRAIVECVAKMQVDRTAPETAAKEDL